VAVRLPTVDRDGRLVLAAKSLRGFAFGLNSVAIGLFMAEVHLPIEQVGLILSASIVGSIGLTLVVMLWGDRIGRRRLLVAGSGLMVLTALVPLLADHGILIALIGLTGMLAVTGRESAGLQTVDQALLPQTAPERDWTSLFVIYELLSAATSGLGALSLGLAPVVAGWLALSGGAAYAPAFVACALAGLVAAGLAGGISPASEVGRPRRAVFAVHRSRRVVLLLSVLFGVDSFSGGFVVQSFLAYWFTTRFGAPPVVIGSVFAAGNILSAVSMPLAVWIAARIGLIRTMVFTHLPANAAWFLLAISPSLEVATLLYLAKSVVDSMDVPTRSAYTMAVVDPDERTATAGITGLARSTSMSVGPLFSSLFLVPLGIGVPLIACGVLKFAYDLSLFGLFRSRPTPGEIRRAHEPSA
jgi:MFS family permease